MTNLDIIEFIDEFLRKQEDVLHGTEGIDCTKSRKYLDMIKKQLPIHGVVQQSDSELLSCKCGRVKNGWYSCTRTDCDNTAFMQNNCG